MTQRHDMILRPAEDGPNPPDLLREIVEDVKKLAPVATDAAGNYLKGKGWQEVAKAKEIMAGIYHKIGQLELERQKLVEQRDEAIRKAELLKDHNKKKHQERMYELKTERRKEKTACLKNIVDCLKALKDMGIEVDMEVLQKPVLDLLKEFS